MLARRRRRRAPTPAERARLRRRPRRRHLRPDDRRRAAASSSATPGSTADGVCGPDDRSLARVDRRSARLADGSVASVREREALRRGPRRLAGRRVFLAVDPGLEALGDRRRARPAGDAGAIVVLDTSGRRPRACSPRRPTASSADLFVAVRTGDEPGLPLLLLRVRTLPVRGRAAASRYGVTESLRRRARGRGACGRTYRLLRETRMAAVVCEPSPATTSTAARDVVTRGPEVGAGDRRRASGAGSRSRSTPDPDVDAPSLARALELVGARRASVMTR